LLTACANRGPEVSFSTLQDDVKIRSGHELQWRRSTEADDRSEKLVRDLITTNLTAESAIQIALVNNPSLQATFEEVGIAHADVIQAGLLRNPRLSGSWRVPTGAGTLNSEYSVAQNILDLVFHSLRTSIAERALNETRLRVTDAVLRLASEVETAYFTAQAREQLIAALRNIVEVDQTALDITQRQREAGNITELELANQKSAFAQSGVFLANALRESYSDRERLNRLLGLWGDQTGWRIEPALPELPTQEMPLDDLEKLAVTRRFDVAAAREQVNSIRMALALRTKTRFLPINFELGLDTEKDSDGKRVTGPALDFELPIFDHGQAAIERLAAQQRRAEQEFRAKAINARSEVRELRDRLIASRDLAEYYRKTLIPIQSDLLRQSLLFYNAMQKGPSDLLTIKRRQLETENEYIEIWRDYWITRTELRRAIGGVSDVEAQPVHGDTKTLPKNASPHDHVHQH